MGYTVFMDIDGCLLDENSDLGTLQRLTVPLDELERVIRRYSESDMRLGFNSNRGLSEIVEVASLLGIDGPIIAEKGAIYHGDKTIEIAQSALVPDRYIRTTHRETKTVQGLHGLYIDGTRTHGIVAYCFENGQPSLSLAHEAIDELSELNPQYEFNLVIHKARVIGHPSGIDKGTAVDWYKTRQNQKVIMIGHDIGDVPALMQADYAMAPQNHSLAIGLDYVSPCPYTLGVIDCLSYALNKFGDVSEA